jgi:pilus assembly protein Flp/PilA
MLTLAVRAQTLFRRLADREEGQTMAEYAVILTVLTVLVLGALTLLSGNISNVINRIADAIS